MADHGTEEDNAIAPRQPYVTARATGWVSAFMNVRDRGSPVRAVCGVLGAVAVAPFLVMLWYALGILAFALSVGSGPAWWVYVIYWSGTAGLVVLDVWIGYLAYRFGN